MEGTGVNPLTGLNRTNTGKEDEEKFTQQGKNIGVDTKTIIVHKH
jgi:hypothetical protein